MGFIHPTAEIHPKAELGEKVFIGPHCYVGRNVQIGNNTKLLSHVVINPGTIIRENNCFHPFSTIGGDPQDLKYKNQNTYLIIGSGNVIRENVTIHRATGITSDRTIIGDNNLLMAGVHIAHDCVVGNGNIFANNVGFAGHCTICNFAVIGAFSIFHQFITIGSYCFVGFGSIIRKNIAPYSKIAGMPAKAIGINKVGMMRKNFQPELIQAIKKASRIILSNQPLAVRVAHSDLVDLYNSYDQVKQLVDFVVASKQGVVTFQTRRTEDIV
ncbi:MAG: acyl-ACP--UDP-N-acetylglucosamine O-acyltransferase [Methylacidiphilales bacterium]|nr:acyl-ACP--UDP-N-acetylglucosamine O-acyltransferase [Candidatus Methylacidiphilales bacterium]